ncbi:hypothetical protein GOBAR_AA19323 [Gossypium barbadense]|uniref:TPR1-like CTLH-containing domain-containing protein n=1 Tax=Gossypium barbadense TaxID=3634 RepID=A0A2P5XDF2_GOSBA|nr:hypothetical protein GOBAR_AA19323 [Gossypium barbadense]
MVLFFDEENFKETVHKLEQESGFFFNMKHFEDQVQAGEWDEVKRYLCGFTKEECIDLQRRIKDGIIKRPSVVSFAPTRETPTFLETTYPITIFYE